MMLFVGVYVPDLTHEVDFSSKEIRAHTSHLLSTQQLKYVHVHIHVHVYV